MNQNQQKFTNGQLQFSLQQQSLLHSVTHFVFLKYSLLQLQFYELSNHTLGRSYISYITQSNTIVFFQLSVFTRQHYIINAPYLSASQFLSLSHRLSIRFRSPPILFSHSLSKIQNLPLVDKWMLLQASYTCKSQIIHDLNPSSAAAEYE